MLSSLQISDQLIRVSLLHRPSQHLRSLPRTLHDSGNRFLRDLSLILNFTECNVRDTSTDIQHGLIIFSQT